MQPPLEDANFGKSMDQVVAMSAADMATFSRPNDADPTTKMATLRTSCSTTATCGTKAGPTSVNDEPRRMWEYKQGMAEPMAPLSTVHLAQLASKSEHEPIPLRGQYPGSNTALSRSEKEEETDEYVKKALTGLVVADEGADASKEELLKIQRQQLSVEASAR